MDFSIHTGGIDTISIALPILHFKGPQVDFFLNHGVFLSLKVVLILADSADPDEMPHYLGLHCLPKYPFKGFQCRRS